MKIGTVEIPNWVLFSGGVGGGVYLWRRLAETSKEVSSPTQPRQLSENESTKILQQRSMAFGGTAIVLFIAVQILNKLHPKTLSPEGLQELTTRLKLLNLVKALLDPSLTNPEDSRRVIGLLSQ